MCWVIILYINIMENIMKFFKDNYELDNTISMDEDDPLVVSMENEFKGFLLENGYPVKSVYSDYFDGIIHCMNFKLENKTIKLSHDDDGIPCVDICDSNDDIIYTIRPKEEVDLHNFVKDLG